MPEVLKALFSKRLWDGSIVVSLKKNIACLEWLVGLLCSSVISSHITVPSECHECLQNAHDQKLVQQRLTLGEICRISQTCVALGMSAQLVDSTYYIIKKGNCLFLEVELPFFLCFTWNATLKRGLFWLVINFGFQHIQLNKFVGSSS